MAVANLKEDLEPVVSTSCPAHSEIQIGTQRRVPICILLRDLESNQGLKVMSLASYRCSIPLCCLHIC